MTDREKLEEIKEASKDAFKISTVEQEADKVYSVSSPSVSTTTIGENYIEKLKLLQEDLQKEVSKNPEIKLTDEYKELQKKYEQIINGDNTNKEKIESLSEIPKEAQEQVSNEEISVESNTETQNEVNADLQEENQNETNNEINIEVQGENQNEVNAEVQEENQNEMNNEINIEVQGENQNEIKDEVQEENQNEMQEENEMNIAVQEKNQNEINTELQEENDMSKPKDNSKTAESIISFEEMYKQLFGKEPYGGRKQENIQENYYTIDANIEDNNLSMFEENENYNSIQYKFIGIAFNTYIILEIEDELYIMDQHAAHERIMYEKVKKNFYSQEEKDSQLLLLPDIIELTNKEMDIAKDNMSLFKQAGFIVEEFGENTIKLSGVPNVCVDLNTAELFKETLDEINTVARTAKQEKEEKFIATIACKSAVKANMKLEKEEVDKLMERLLQLPNPFTCPHGRPTVIKMSKYEIERKFARK